MFDMFYEFMCSLYKSGMADACVFAVVLLVALVFITSVYANVLSVGVRRGGKGYFGAIVFGASLFTAMLKFGNAYYGNESYFDAALYFGYILLCYSAMFAVLKLLGKCFIKPTEQSYEKPYEKPRQSSGSDYMPTRTGKRAVVEECGGNANSAADFVRPIKRSAIKMNKVERYFSRPDFGSIISKLNGIEANPHQREHFGLTHKTRELIEKCNSDDLNDVEFRELNDNLLTIMKM